MVTSTVHDAARLVVTGSGRGLVVVLVTKVVVEDDGTSPPQLLSARAVLAFKRVSQLPRPGKDRWLDVPRKEQCCCKLKHHFGRLLTWDC